MDLGVPLADPHLQQIPPEVGIQQARHFLYFHTEANARQVQQRLSASGFRIEVRRAAQGADWLVLVSSSWTTEESLSQTRNELENLAVQFGGEYDGWELEVDPVIS
jgi:hypothetical protein